MKNSTSPSRLRLLLSLLVLTAVGLAGAAQAAGPVDRSAAPGKPKAPASHFAGALQAERNLDRIVIKFKQPAATRAGAFSATAAQSTVSALGAANKKLNSAAPDLRYLKSVTRQAHVALTSQKMSRAELHALTRQLAQDPSVAYAHIDEKAYPTMVPNDPYYAAYQWHYEAPGVYAGGANLPLAWDSSTGSGVIVAVLDTGYRPHADLAANILPGYDFVSIGTAPIDPNDGDGWDADAQDPGDWCGGNSSWHGTHVAGTIGAVTNNGTGVAGVAYNAKVLPVRVLGTCGGWGSDIAAGMLWAAGIAVPGVPNNPNKAKVLNLSLGGANSCSAIYQDVVNQVRAAGSVVVAATGNDGTSAIGQPANCGGVIAVTAHVKNGDNATYANYGPGTTISGPGGGFGYMIAGDGAEVWSTYNTGATTPGSDSYAGLMGTSMATPHVAGVVALLASLQPAITPDMASSVLVSSQRPHPAGTYCNVYPSSCGATGLVDAKAAIDYLVSLAPTASVTPPPGVQTTGSTVTLTGSGTGQGGASIASYLWTQTAGPALTLSGSTTSTLSFTAPTPGNSYSFTLEVIDSNGLKGTSAPVTVTTNTAPVLAAVPAQSVAFGLDLSFTLTASDAEGNPLVYTAVGLPTGATLDATTGVFTWLGAGPAGNYSFTVTVSDGIFDSNIETVSIAVTTSTGGGGGGGGAIDLGGLLGLASLFALGLWVARRQRAQQ